MNYGGLYTNDTLNGTGFRTTLFVSGCLMNPKCPFCQNQKAWNFKYGEEFSRKEEDLIIEYLKPSYISGLSLLGGEIFDNLEEDTLFNLMERIKNEYGDTKDVWCWTGYEYEYLIQNDRKQDFMKYLDVLIDGRFEIEKKNLNLKFRNSSNQRPINVQETIKQGEVMLFDW